MDILIFDSKYLDRSQIGQQHHSVLWNRPDFQVSDNIIFIHDIIDNYEESIRDAYLLWVKKCGETLFDCESINSKLELRKGYSYWWSTLCAHKSNWVISPQINDAIKLIAFDQWAKNKSIEKMKLISSNKALAACLESWCNNHTVNFKWKKNREVDTHYKKSGWMFRHLYETIPLTFQAFIWLFYYIFDRWWLFGKDVRGWRATKAHLLIVDYLFSPVMNVDGFSSRYWQYLPDLLKSEGVEVNWLHIFVKSKTLPTSRSAAKLLRRVKKNHAEKGKKIHVTLDAFFSFRILLQTIKDWIKLSSVSKGANEILGKVKINDLALWPLFEKESMHSFSGRVSMCNLLYLNLLESAFQQLPKQKLGLYLLENQSWELSLLYAWRHNNNGSIIGFPHATVRFWDLRYFNKIDNYNSKGARYMPMPDRVAVSGPLNYNAYIKSGFPANKIIEVEALRYLYLNKIQITTSTRRENGKIRLLVLGDYTEIHTKIQMKILNGVVDELEYVSITVKPHPACPIYPDEYPNISFSISLLPINELLMDADIVYTSAVTSATLDAYCAGLPVISVLDQVTLDMSPLRRYNEVVFIETSIDLAKAIKEIAKKTNIKRRSRTDIFHLDLKLIRWKRLFESFQNEL